MRGLEGKKPKNNHKPRVGVGLSLDKFAKAKVSKYDKRQVKERAKQLHLNRLAKYRKLKAKLQKQGKLPPATAQLPIGDRSDVDAAQHHGTDPTFKGQAASLSAEQEPDNSAGDACSKDQLNKAKNSTDMHKGKHKKKPPSSLERLAQKVKAEKEAEREAKEQLRRAAEARRQEIEEAKKQRKQLQQQFRKRTAHGQPVMKVRMDKMLAQLQKR